MRRRSPSTPVLVAMACALLLHGLTLVAADTTRQGPRAAEIAARAAADADLALPAARAPELAKPLRSARLLANGRTDAPRLVPGAVRTSDRNATRATPPRARSHATRLRTTPPDDPPQPIVRT